MLTVIVIIDLIMIEINRFSGTHGA
jgi:hypothetical protein